MVASGLDGLQSQTPLTMKGSRGTSSKPMSDEMKAELGVTERLPRDLEDALEVLKADSEVFKEASGEKCVCDPRRRRRLDMRERRTWAKRRKMIVASI